jgi:hypothetical protein
MVEMDQDRQTYTTQQEISEEINFRCLQLKKGCRQGPGSGNLGGSLVKATISQRQYQYQNHKKNHTVKKPTFYVFTPCLF